MKPAKKKKVFSRDQGLKLQDPFLPLAILFSMVIIFGVLVIVGF